MQCDICRTQINDGDEIISLDLGVLAKDTIKITICGKFHICVNCLKEKIGGDRSGTGNADTANS